MTDSLLPSEIADKCKIYKNRLPAINFSENPVIVLDEPYQDASIVTYTSGMASNNNVTITANLINSPQTFWNRLVYIEILVDYTFIGPYPNPPYNVNNPLLRPGLCGIDTYGIMGVINTLNVKMNNFSNTIQLRNVLMALNQYIPRDVLRQDLSALPTKRNAFQDIDQWLPDGGYLNHLSAYGESEIMGSNSFPYESDVTTDLGGNPGRQQQVVRFKHIFPLLVSPFIYHSKNNRSQYMTNVNNLTVDMTFDPLINSFCCAKRLPGLNPGPGNQIDQAFASIVGNPKMRIQYIRQQPYIPLLPWQLYNYEDTTVFQRDSSTVTASFNPPETLTADAISLGIVPDWIYVYIAQKDSLRDFRSSQYRYAAITNLSISLNTRNNLLATYNQHELYRICVENGYTDTFRNFQVVGSVIKLRVNKDVTIIDSLLSSGSQSRITLQISCQYQNVSRDPTEFTIYTIMVNNGVLVSYPTGNMQSFTGFITPQNVLNAPLLNDAAHSDKNLHAVVNDFYGSAIGDFGKYVYRVGKKIKENASPILDAMESAVSILQPQYAPAARTVRKAIRDTTGYGFLDSSQADGMVGGKRMSKKKMQKKLLKY